MKRYIAENTVPTGNGTHLKINDLATLQAYGFAMDKLLTDFNTPFVLSGGVLTPLTYPNFAVSEGIVLLNGKLHTLPAITSLNLASPKYIAYLSNTQSDARPLFGGGTANVFETYLAQVMNLPPVTGDYIVIGAEGFPLPTRFADLSVRLADTIHTDTPLAPFLTSSWIDYAPIYPLSIRKSFRQEAQLIGRAKYNGGGNANIAQILGIAYLPERPHFYTVPITLPSNVYENAPVMLLPDGSLRLCNSPLNYVADTIFCLDTIHYKTIL